jgi:hypothetical protein
VFARVDTREAHERHDPEKERDQSRAPERGGEPHPREIAHEPQEGRDVQDVTGRERRVPDVMRDVNEGRRRARPRHERLHNVLESRGAQRRDPGGECGPSSPDREDDENNEEIEDIHERRESQRAEAGERKMEPCSRDALDGPRDPGVDGSMRDLMGGDGEQRGCERGHGAQGATSPGT